MGKEWGKGPSQVPTLLSFFGGPVALNLKVRSTKAWRDLNWTWLLIWSTSLWERWWRHPPGTRTLSMLKPTRFYIRTLWSCQADRKIRWDRVSKMMKIDIKLLHSSMILTNFHQDCRSNWLGLLMSKHLLPLFDISFHCLSVTSPPKAPRSNNLESHTILSYLIIVDLPRSFLNMAKSQIFPDFLELCHLKT